MVSYGALWYLVYLVNQNAGPSIRISGHWPAKHVIHIFTHAHRPFLTILSDTAQKKNQVKKKKKKNGPIHS